MNAFTFRSEKAKVSFRSTIFIGLNIIFPILIGLTLRNFILSTQSYLEVGIASQTDSTLQVFYSQNEEFREKDSYSIKTLGGLKYFRINVPENTRYFRIDPTNTLSAVQINRLRYKPQGRKGFVNLINIPPIAKENIRSYCIDNQVLTIVPDAKNDPYFISPNLDNEKNALPLLSPKRKTIITLATLLIFNLLIISFTPSPKFPNTWKPLKIRSSYLLPPFVKNALSVKLLLFTLLPAIIISLYLVILNIFTYDISFKITSNTEANVQCFYSKGEGFSKRNKLGNYPISQKKETLLHYSFKSISPPISLRIDPSDLPASTKLKNLKIRKWGRNWKVIDLRTATTGSNIKTLNQSEDSIELESLSDDPYLIIPINDFERSSIPSLKSSLTIILKYFFIFFPILLLISIIGSKTDIKSYSIRIKSVKRWTFSISGLYLFIFAIVHTSFFPGSLCGDTAGNMRSAMEGVISPFDPPLIQWGMLFLQKFTFSQWPLLTIQHLLYFSGFWILSIALIRKKSPILSLSMLFICIIPSSLSLQSMVIKDAWIGASWLNIVALSILSGTIENRTKKIFLSFFSIILLVFSILSRDNTFLATPALLFFNINAWKLTPIKNTTLKRLATTAGTIAALLIALSSMQFLNKRMLGNTETRDYEGSFFVNQVCRNDLISLSILSNHSGVTGSLPTKEKLFIEKIYLTHPIFWLDQELTNQMFPNKYPILENWIQSVTNNPFNYLKHRFHIFLSLFIAKPSLQTMWITDADDLGNFEKTISIQGKTNMDMFRTPELLRDNFIRETYKNASRKYFKKYSDIVILSITTLGILVILLPGYNYKEEKSLAIGSLLLFCFYALPNLFFVQHPESRYVYPVVLVSLAIIPLTLPKTLKSLFKS